MNELMFLLQVFTRLPIKKELDYSADSMKKASVLLSLVGAFTYFPAAFISLLLIFLKCPPGINAFITLAVHFLFTGAYHLDGLSDTVDGLFSGREKDRILEIMKDSRIGSYGTIALIIDIGIKATVFTELIVTRRIWILPLLGAAGKLSLNLVSYLGDCAKENSSGNIFIRSSTVVSILINFLVFMIIGYFTKEIRASLITVIILLLFSAGFAIYTKKKIGGMVGDNLGFASEIGEIIIGIFSLWA